MHFRLSAVVSTASFAALEEKLPSSCTSKSDERCSVRVYASLIRPVSVILTTIIAVQPCVVHGRNGASEHQFMRGVQSCVVGCSDIEETWRLLRNVIVRGLCGPADRD